jgi:hypothetical protein
MAIELESATFKDRVGDPFQIAPQDGGAVFEAVLSRCEETSYGDRERWRRDIGRVPFSLIFEAPLDTSAPQQIFTITHDQLGAFELFLVPIGPQAGGLGYEAVIS